MLSGKGVRHNFRNSKNSVLNITKAEFVKGVVGEDEILEDGIPQVAFLGRSNVGKSSVINTLVKKKELARSSPTPGRTQQANFYLINNSFYLVDLPGYGFAKGSKDHRKILADIIEWYILHSGVEQKVIVLIIDAFVGVTPSDKEVMGYLEDAGKNFIVVANKIDKVKKSQLKQQLEDIVIQVHPHPVIPYSATDKIGVTELTNLVTKK